MSHLFLLFLAALPFDWAAAHMHLIGWPAVVGIAWKVSRAVSKFTNRVDTTMTQIDTMSTNHFPHMEQSLARQDVFLENIDKNIGRLADKL